MNIFMPMTDIYESVKSLDDNRLRKQILEVWQLCELFKREQKGELFGRGYHNHPVYKYYSQNINGYYFMQLYGMFACKEYKYRFGQEHKLAYAFKSNAWGFCFHPAYIAGQKAKGTQEIDDTDRAYGKYRKKLTEKWDNDKQPPKWTKRFPPPWYKVKENNE